MMAYELLLPMCITQMVHSSERRRGNKREKPFDNNKQYSKNPNQLAMYTVCCCCIVSSERVRAKWAQCEEYAAIVYRYETGGWWQIQYINTHTHTLYVYLKCQNNITETIGDYSVFWKIKRILEMKLLIWNIVEMCFHWNYSITDKTEYFFLSIG